MYYSSNFVEHGVCAHELGRFFSKIFNSFRKVAVASAVRPAAQLISRHIPATVLVAAGLGSLTALAFPSVRRNICKVAASKLFSFWNRPNAPKVAHNDEEPLRQSSAAAPVPLGGTAAVDISSATAAAKVLPAVAVNVKEVIPQQLNKRTGIVPQDFNNLITDTIKALSSQGTNSLAAIVVPVGSRIITIGDIHGGGDEFMSNINWMRQMGYFEHDNPWRLRDGYYLVMMGDIADRGPDSILCWYLALTLLQNNPGKMFTIRGNHETKEKASRSPGGAACIFDQLKNGGYPPDVFDKLCRLFEYMLHALFVGMKNQKTNITEFGMFCHNALTLENKKEVVAAAQDVMVAATKNEGRAQFKQPLGPNADFYMISTETNYTANEVLADVSEKINGQFLLQFPSLNTAKDYMNSLSSPISHSVVYTICGHNHNSGGVLQLKAIGKWEGTDNYWTPLTEQQPIKQGDVLCVMSVSLKAYPYFMDQGFAETTLNPRGQWTIVPYITQKGQLH